MFPSHIKTQGSFAEVQPNLLDHLVQFSVWLDQMHKDHIATNYSNVQPDTTQLEFGQNWVRVVKVHPSSTGGSAYCFVALKDFSTKQLGNVKAGDIHKPAGYKAPAKHARGSVFHPEQFGKVCGPHSVVYLR